MTTRFAVIVLGMALLAGCDNSESKTPAPQKPNAPAPSATQPTTKPAVVYYCPMDAGVVSDKPGKCPKCGMGLEVKK